MESITYEKRGSIPLVWNLEVEGCPHFEVEGVALVHNSTTFKHSNTKRFKLLKPYLPYFKRRYIMTGTPSPNGLLDLFGQVYLLDLGAALSPYITHYRATYFFCRDRFGWNWTLNPGADKLIQKQIAHLMYRPDVKDFKEPIAQDNVIRVELPPKARKIYDELETQLITTLEKTKVVTARTLLTQQWIAPEKVFFKRAERWRYRRI